MCSVAPVPRLWSSGSAVVAHGFSCSSACGIFPDQGWNPCLLHWQVDSLPLSHQGSPRLWHFLLDVYYILDTADKYSLLSYKSEPKYQVSECPNTLPLRFCGFEIQIFLMSDVKGNSPTMRQHSPPNMVTISSTGQLASHHLHWMNYIAGTMWG